MANFNVDLSAPSASGARPLAPVSTPSSRYENPFLSLGSDLAKIFAKNSEENKKKEALDEKNRIIGNFVKDQNALAEAGKQGMDDKQVLARARANFASYSANYPALITEFTEANRSIENFTELGAPVRREQAAEDMWKQMKSDYIKDGGWIPDGASLDYQKAAIQQHQAIKAQNFAFENTVKRASEQRAQEGADRQRIDWDIKQQGIQLLQQIGSSHLQTTQQFITETVAKAKTAGPEVALADMNRYFSNIEGAITQAAAANPELAGGWRTLFEGMKKSGLDAISGKATTEALDNQLKEIITKGQLIAVQDPQMLGVTAASRLIGGTMPESFWQANNAVRNSLIRIGNAYGGADIPVVIGDNKAEKVTFDVLTHNMKLLSSGSVSDPEGVKRQVSNAANNILSQVNSTSVAGIEPAKLDAVSKFIASPTYAQMVQQGMIDKSAAQGAKGAFELTFEKGVSKSIVAGLDKQLGTSPSGEPIPVSAIVDFKWNGAGVQIGTLPNPGKAPNMPLASGNDVSATLIAMKPAEKALNQIIHMGAHLEGHTDYAKYWEENKHRILPNYYPDPQMLKPGQVENGFKYKGGNYRDKNNWEKVGSE